MTHVDVDPTLDQSTNSETRDHEILTVEETFQKYMTTLIHYAKGFGVSDPEATVMDVFEKALIQVEKRGADTVLHPGWYFWVTHNTAINELRRSTRRKEDLVDWELSDHSNRPDPISTAAFTSVEFEEIMRHIDRALADKPKHWRSIIAKRALHGDAYKEISDDLGIPVGTVGKTLISTKAALRNDGELLSALGVSDIVELSAFDEQAV